MLPSDLNDYHRESDWHNDVTPDPLLEITVIIPVHNVAANLLYTLEALARQSLPCTLFEVVVVDNGSQDSLLEKLRAGAWPFLLRYYFQRRKGRQSGKCRNIAIANARGKLVVMLDADCLCSRRFLEHHLRLHRQQEARYVIGDVRLLDEQRQLDHRIKITPDVLQRSWLPGQTTFKGWLRISLHHWLQHWAHGGSSALRLWLSGGNCSVKCHHLREAGGYDESFDGFYGDEDADLGYRLEKVGVKPCFSHQAMVYHQWHPTGRKGDPVRNRLLLLRKHPELRQRRLLMRAPNRFYGMAPEELEVLYHHADE